MPPRTMKTCPVCGEANPAWAATCSCGTSLEGVTAEPATMAIRIPPAMILGVLLCLVAFGLMWMIRQTGKTGLDTGGPKTLKVVWHKFYGSAAKEWIVGDVKNQSKTTLKRVLVVGDFYSDDGHLVQSASAPLEQSPLAPGQVSHFKVTVPYSKQWDIQQSWFHFQTPEGEQIPFER